MKRAWRVLIADDEPLGRRRMVLALRHVDNVSLVGEAVDGASARAMIHDLDPDIVLLDIEMPGLSGLEVCADPSADTMRRAFVFITAHEQFARAAFDVAAIDYLLKPFSIDRFEQALARATHHCSRDRGSGSHGGAKSAPGQILESLWVSDRRGKRRIALDLVEWIGAERDFSRLYLGAETLLYSEPMGRLEAQLPEGVFLRVHRSALVRIDRVQRLLRTSTGQIQLETGSPVLAPVGRRFSSRVRQVLGATAASSAGRQKPNKGNG